MTQIRGVSEPPRSGPRPCPDARKPQEPGGIAAGQQQAWSRARAACGGSRAWRRLALLLAGRGLLEFQLKSPFPVSLVDRDVRGTCGPPGAPPRCGRCPRRQPSEGRRPNGAPVRIRPRRQASAARPDRSPRGASGPWPPRRRSAHHWGLWLLVQKLKLISLATASAATGGAKGASEAGARLATAFLHGVVFARAALDVVEVAA
jgi:hypothetical protein